MRLPVELVRKFKGRCSETGRKYQDVVEAVVRNWLANAALTADLKAKAPRATKVPLYKPENLPWHDRLETVLNDPHEAIGIQKNLEWAEKTVLAKTPPRKQPTGS